MIRAFVPPLALSVVAWLVLGNLRSGRPGSERAGLAVLCGIGGGTTLLFLAGAAGLPLHPAPVFLLLLAAAAVSIALSRRLHKPGPPAGGRANAEPWTPVEVALLALAAGLFLLSVIKANYYPVVALDAHSYDGRARWIAAEGTLDISVYRTLHVHGSSNLSYPPLFPLSLALGYWAGAPQGKAVDSFYFAAILLVMYGVMGRRLPRSGALAGTLLLAATPEVWNHASLALTNLPAMACFGAGALLVLADDSPMLAGLLFAFGAGVRSDAAVVAAPVALVALLPGGRWRRPQAAARRLLALLGPAALLTAVWQLYLKGHLGEMNDAPFRPALFGDPALLVRLVEHTARIVTLPALYGWTFPLFAAAIVLAFAAPGSSSAERGEFRNAALATLLGVVALALLFWKLDLDRLGGVDEILSTSFKRSIFYIVPLALTATLLSPPARRMLARFDAWQKA